MGAGDASRRLAHRTHDGVQDYPVDAGSGFCAETGGSITRFAATWLGIPVSTTHTITGSIVGVGAVRKVSAVRWNVASNIVIAWVVTLPAAGLMAALFYTLCGLVV